MIFASVGSMLPFDRFVRAVDDWAAANPHKDVFVQIGETEYEPQHAPFARMIPMAEYRQRLHDCDLFVAVGSSLVVYPGETLRVRGWHEDGRIVGSASVADGERADAAVLGDVVLTTV